MPNSCENKGDDLQDLMKVDGHDYKIFVKFCPCPLLEFLTIFRCPFPGEVPVPGEVSRAMFSSMEKFSPTNWNILLYIHQE